MARFSAFGGLGSAFHMILVGCVQQSVHALRELLVGAGFIDLGIGEPDVFDLPIVSRQIMLEAFG